MKRILLAATVAAAAIVSSCNHNPKANLKNDIDTVSYEMGMLMSPGEQLPAYLTQAGSDSTAIADFVKGYVDGIAAGNDKKKQAYYMGVMQGMQSKMQMSQLEGQIFQGDSTKKVNTKNFVAGFCDAINESIVLKNEKGDSMLTKEEANQHIMQYMFSKLKNEGAEFLAKKEKEAGVKKLAEGVLLKEVKAGDGTTKPTLNDSIVVTYEGTLTDGNMFDTSAHRDGNKATFALKNMIGGWQIAMPEMSKGGEYEIYVPYQQAYKETGHMGIPPFAALVFKVTLLDVKAAK